MSDIKQVWYTKYALTSGIVKKNVTVKPLSKCYKVVDSNHLTDFISVKECFDTFEEARADAEERKNKKIKALERQLLKMNALKFTEESEND